MQSGLETTSNRNYGRFVQSPNWVRYALSRPLVETPGGRRIYSTGNTHLLSAIITRSSGLSTLDFARRYLAEPLGIRLPARMRDPQGVYFGGNDMQLRPRDIPRLDTVVVMTSSPNPGDGRRAHLRALYDMVEHNIVPALLAGSVTHE